MNIVEFWKNQSKIWNDEQKCGFCWVFAGATTVEGMEEYRTREESKCCVHVFITNDGFNEQITYRNPPFPSGVICQEFFDVWLVMPSRIDLNDHLEIDGHPIEESTEETILTPLKECVHCQVGLDMCEANEGLFEITKWQGSKVRNFTSKNYTGWKISAMFQERN